MKLHSLPTSGEGTGMGAKQQTINPRSGNTKHQTPNAKREAAIQNHKPQTTNPRSGNTKRQTPNTKQ